MEAYVAEYAVELPDSTSRWVPIEYIKHLYAHDKNFRFRLGKFLNGLTESTYRMEEEDVVEELGLKNIGSSFLSWDMTLTVMLHETQGRPAKKEKAAGKEVPLVQEEKVVEDNLPEHVEASMALMLLQAGENVEEDDRMLELDEVIEAIPEMDIRTLNPIIIDGKEFLFLDDIMKSVGIREDEALSMLANTTNMHDEGETIAKEPTIQIDFEDHNLSKSLEYISYVSQRTLEENVAAALVAIQDVALEMNVSESAFTPHSTFTSMKVDHSSSFDIQLQYLVESDDAIETAFTIDKFAARGSGIRISKGGQDSSLWHYLPRLSPEIVRVFHTDYTEEAHTEMLKCKAFSIVLCEDPLANNANKCILVSREAALWAFAGNYPHGLLGHCGISLGLGIDSPQAIAESLGQAKLEGPSVPTDMRDLLKNLYLLADFVSHFCL